MRLVRVLVDEDRRSDVVGVLESEGIDMVVMGEDRSSGGTVVVEFPLPTQAVGYVLDRLREVGIDDSRYMVIASAETARTANYPELEDRFVASTEEDDSVATEEIRAKALDLYRRPLTYHSMTVLSAIVAAAGLLLNSPAIVVGAMVIAPQVGSAMMTSVGLVIDDRRMVSLGLRSQATGLGLAVVAAIVLGYLLRSGAIVASVLDVSTVSQISKRISPGLLSFLVAVCAGGAGAFGLATALPVSLVGVMIAAAIIPAAAAVGIGIAWGIPSVAVGAGLLLVVNTVVVNLSGVVVLRGLGYRPADGEGGRQPRDPDAGDSHDAPHDGDATVAAGGFGGYVSGRVRSSPGTVLAAAALVGILVVAAVPVAAQVGFENDVNSATSVVFDDPAYSDLEVTSVQPEIVTVRQFGDRPEVQIQVTRPEGREYPRLAQRLERAIEDRAGVDVDVIVEFTDRSQSG